MNQISISKKDVGPNEAISVSLPSVCSTVVLAGVNKCLGRRSKDTVPCRQSHRITYVNTPFWYQKAVAFSSCCWYSNYLEWTNGRFLERKAKRQRVRGVEERERGRKRWAGEMLWGAMVAGRLLSRIRGVLESFGISNVLHLCWFSKKRSFLFPPHSPSSS